jgi:hypothetical protein
VGFVQDLHMLTQGVFGKIGNWVMLPTSKLNSNDSQVSGASIFLLPLQERVTPALFKNFMIRFSGCGGWFFDMHLNILFYFILTQLNQQLYQKNTSIFFRYSSEYSEGESIICRSYVSM